MSHTGYTHYAPESPPVDNEVTEWMRRELEKIAAILETPDVPEYHAAPSKPRDGQLARADGTHWDPGSGAGLYIYDAATWKLIVAL